MTWNLATPEQAVLMASQNPRDLMGPALRRFSVEMDSGEVEWSPNLRPLEVRVGPVRRTFDGV